MAMALTLSAGYAETALDETWEEQGVGDSIKDLVQWDVIGNPALSDGAIVEENGHKELHWEQADEKPYASLGIQTKNEIGWEKELRISLSLGLKSAVSGPYHGSIVIVARSGQQAYQINLRKNEVMVSRIDPDHPNPDATASNPAFTPIYKSSKAQNFETDDLQTWSIKFTKNDGQLTLNINKEGDDPSAGISVSDPMPVNLSNGTKISISVENKAEANLRSIHVDKL